LSYGRRFSSSFYVWNINKIASKGRENSTGKSKGGASGEWRSVMAVFFTKADVGPLDNINSGQGY
jgi:hypothetical protein